MSVKVFRFHEGADLYGWDNSNPLNDKAIAAIKDPNGEHASREITSIPSPFARIDLVNTAFKEVANRDLEGDTIYHKMVSDALDIGEILFNFEKYQDKIEIISWDPKNDLQTLLDSSNSGHRSLGESLRLFLQQDAKTYNFDKMHKLYLLNYKLGANPINIIGGTSPASLFFTSANKFNLDGFMSGNDVFFDDDFCPLHKRESAFIEYIFLLSKITPNFTTDFKNLNEYLVKVFPLLSGDLKIKLNNQDVKGAYGDLPNLSIDGGGQNVEVLNVLLKKSKGNIEQIKNSDFILNSPKNFVSKKPVLVLPNDIISPGYKYVTADWDTNNKASSYEATPLSVRRLPFDGSQYPYLVISDFLEPVLIRTHLPIDDYYFENGNINSEAGYLFPLKPLFFKYFSLDALRQSINGEKMFEIKTLSNGSVDVFLRLPVQNNKHITYKRTYFNPVSQAHKPEFNEIQNKGAIIENQINFGITPFYKFPNTVNPEYNVGFYDADSNPLMSGNKYHLKFYTTNNEVVNSVQQTQRRFKEEENINMYGLVVSDNFDYIQVINDFAKGILVPKFDANVSGGSDQFTVAIDFGTTNTHIEFSKNQGISIPFDLGPTEGKHFGHLIDDEKHDEAFLKLANIDLLPNIIQKGGLYEFPQRTIMAYHKRTNFAQPIFAMANIAIPFQYEKKSFAVNTEVKTNIKWNKDANSSEIMQSFFEQLIKMIRDKIILNNGDLNKTKIIWSYPASMMMFELNGLEQKWDTIIEKYFGGNVTVSKVCESLTPFYYYINEEGKSALEKPIASIDIGGGTADVAIYKGEKPILFTSYKFAGDAIFGDNYRRNININGFVQKYTKILTDKLNENGLGDLATVMHTIYSRNNSNDAINGLFSLENHQQIKNKQVKISFLEELKDDTELKMIFLLFYSAHIYHLAEIFKARKLDVPASVSFSGTASKLLTIIDASKQKKSLKLIAESIFVEVYNSTDKLSIEILLKDNPKEIASKGAIYYTESNQVDLKDIREILINQNTLSSQSGSFTYDHVDDLEKDTLKDYDAFLTMFFNLNKQISFKDYFGIENNIIKMTKEFLETKKVNAMKMGIQEKRSELENHSDEEISETFFFYPLVGSLGELAYNLVKKD